MEPPARPRECATVDITIIYGGKRVPRRFPLISIRTVGWCGGGEIK